MTKSEIIEKINKIKNNPSLPEPQRALLLAKYNKELESMDDDYEEEPEEDNLEPEPKKKGAAKPKAAAKPRAAAKPKAEPKSSAKPKALDDYFIKECNDLKEQAKERKEKAVAAAKKRASQPKKTQATKNTEAVEKTSERVEKNVEKRVKKGEVTVDEIRRIIVGHEEAIRKLKMLLKQAEEKKMARGGGIDADEDRRLLNKAHAISDRHCGCGGSKMATGGGVDSTIFEFGYDIEWVDLNGKKKSANFDNLNDAIEMYQNILMNGAQSTSFSYDAKTRKMMRLRKNQSNASAQEALRQTQEALRYATAGHVRNYDDEIQPMANGGKLIGDQYKLDRNKNGKIDSEDLRMIRENRGGKLKPKMVRSQFEEEEFEYGAGGNIPIVYVSKAELLKQSKQRKTLSNEDFDAFFNKMLSHEMNGRKYYSLGYDLESRGTVQTKDSAIRQARVLQKLFRNDPKFDVIIKETLGNWGANNNPKKYSNGQDAVNTWVVMTSPKLKMNEQFMREHNLRMAKGGSLSAITDTSDVELGQGEFFKRGGKAKPKMVRTQFEEEDFEYGDGGKVWNVTDVSNAKHLGIIEFQDNDGEYHNFEIMETDDRLVFGGFTNSGFIESGYIEKDGFSTDEALQELLADLETYYNDGEEYTSGIVVNERMARGGSVGKPTNKEVFDNGDILDSWSSDIGGSNESEDLVMEYKGQSYLVSIDNETQSVIKPTRLASVYEMKKGGGVDGNYAAQKAGKRTSSKFSTVHMKNGSFYTKRNENQYGKTQGGNTYYENRKTHSDKKRFLAKGGEVHRGDMK